MYSPFAPNTPENIFSGGQKGHSFILSISIYQDKLKYIFLNHLSFYFICDNFSFEFCPLPLYLALYMCYRYNR